MDKKEKMKDFHIKIASVDEIQLMLNWADSEGWNPGLTDAHAFQLIDPTGFFIGRSCFRKSL